MVGNNMNKSREVVCLLASNLTGLVRSKSTCWEVMENKPGRKAGSSYKALECLGEKLRGPRKPWKVC